MAYVYKITNDINEKMYIGQTTRSIEERFDDHRREMLRKRSVGRPLYDAMRKYGISHFHIELIEETNKPKEREIFWIEYYGTFKNGYNATFGGDGKHYIDYDIVVETYKQINNMEDTAKILNISPDSVRIILDIMNERHLSSTEVMVNKYGKMVNMYDLDNNYIQTFSTAYDAGRFLIENGFTNCKLSTIRTHIMEVCCKKRKTASGFKWEYVSM